MSHGLVFSQLPHFSCNTDLLQWEADGSELPHISCIHAQRGSEKFCYYTPKFGTVWGIWQLFVNVFDSLMNFWKKSQWSKKGFYGVPPVTQNNHQAFQGCLSIPLLWDCPRLSFQDLSEGYSCYRLSSEGRRDLFNLCNSQALHSAKDFKTTLPYYYVIFLSSLVVTQMPTVSYSFEMHIYVSLVS